MWKNFLTALHVAKPLTEMKNGQYVDNMLSLTVDTLQISHVPIITGTTESYIHLDRLLSQFLLRVGGRV